MQTINNLISAIQFITILPVGKKIIYSPLGMIKYFPVVGLILGAMLCMFDQIAVLLWPKPVVAMLDVVFLIIVTGAFHLDGVGDAADGLLGHRDRDKVLHIMKDSTIGVMAFAAISCCLALKWGGIASLFEIPDIKRVILLFIIPAYSRGSMIFGLKFLKYGRSKGTGHDLFKDDTFPISNFSFLALPIVLSLFLGLQGLLLNIFFIIIVIIILIYYKIRMNCITGDMLGAMTEITESMLFILVSATF